NLASRVESFNKQAGTSLLVSETVWESVRAQACRGLKLKVPLKGKSGKYPLYEITALAPTRRRRIAR
ncbi:MAG: guanylate cyclase, partial [Betaproteobacteria bacterium]